MGEFLFLVGGGLLALGMVRSDVPVNIAVPVTGAAILGLYGLAVWARRRIRGGRQ